MKTASLAGSCCLTLLAMTATHFGVRAETLATGATVVIDRYMFELKEIHIRVGDSVVWVNQDDVPHTVVDVEKQFHSGALDTHDEFRFTFTKAGTYRYYCSLHPQMTATVVVAAP